MAYESPFRPESGRKVRALAFVATCHFRKSNIFVAHFSMDIARSAFSSIEHKKSPRTMPGALSCWSIERSVV